MRALPWLPTYRRLWALLLRHRGPFALAVVCMALGAAATGGFAALTGPALRLLFDGGGSAFLGPKLGEWTARLPPARLRAILPLALVTLGAIRAGCGFVQADRLGVLTLRLLAELQEALHARLLAMPASYFEGRHTGEIFSRFGNDLGEVERALGMGIATSVRDVLQLVALVAVSAWLDARLLLLTALVVPATLWPIARFAAALRRISHEAQERHAGQVAAAQEALSGAAVLRAYGAEAAALRAYARGEDALLAVQRRSFAVRAAFTPTLELMAFAALAVLLLAVSERVIALPPTDLISFLGAILLTYQPLKSLANSSQWLFPGLAAAERLFAVLDAVPALADRPHARPLSRTPGELTFDRVTVRYGERVALSELSVSLRVGEKVGLVGPSGAGKSTLIQLVPRLRDPSAGRILLGGVDLRDLTLASLRRQVALVAQEIFLFDASVEENVSAAAPGASRRAVEAALDAAGALDFARALPEGLDTRLGERGASLSGGQRQRLAIARALLKDAPILLLDEATSALDSATEAQVQGALGHLMERRTVLVVAHRLSTVRSVDRLLVMEEGRLVEEGAPEALWAAGGLYRRLSDLQAGVAVSG